MASKDPNTWYGTTIISVRKNGKVVEKGPLFKIDPRSFDILFPDPEVYTLAA